MKNTPRFIINGTDTVFIGGANEIPRAVECKMNDVEFCKATCPKFQYTKTNFMGHPCSITISDCTSVYVIPSENFTDLREAEKLLKSKGKLWEKLQGLNWLVK